MRKYSKHLMVAITAAAILAAAVGTASANRLSISNRNIRVVWTPLSFNAGASALVRCNVTLEGSFHSNTIAKVARALIGHISRANVARPCAAGTAWAYNGSEVNEVLGGTLASSLPWHLTYESFEGTLPNITGVHLLLTGARFLLRATVFGVTLLCNYTTGASGNAAGIAQISGGVVTGLRADERREIRSESGGLCPAGNFSGTGAATLLGTTTALTIRLI